MSNGVGVATDIIGKESAWDAPLAPYFDHAEIAWSPDSKQLAYTCKPLTGKEYAVSTDSDIFVYDLENGTTRNLCKDVAHLPFVGYDKYPVWSPKGDKIAFRSQERPGNEADKERLMICDLASGEIKYLTKNFDYHATNVVWDGEEQLYFIAPIEATHQICRVKADGSGEVEVKVLWKVLLFFFLHLKAPPYLYQKTFQSLIYAKEFLIPYYHTLFQK